MLFYGTLGLAYGELKGQTFALDESKTHAGWAGGVGMEVGFTPNWSAKFEYLYMDLGNRAYSITGVDNGIAVQHRCASASTTTSKIRRGADFWNSTDNPGPHARGFRLRRCRAHADVEPHCYKLLQETFPRKSLLRTACVAKKSPRVSSVVVSYSRQISNAHAPHSDRQSAAHGALPVDIDREGTVAAGGALNGHNRGLRLLRVRCKE